MFPGRNIVFPYAGVFVEEQVEQLKLTNSVNVLIIDGFRGYHIYLLGYIKALLFVFLGKYDVIHVHYGLTGLFSLLLPKSYQSKLVVTLHGGDILPVQGKTTQVALTRRVLRKAAWVIAVSKEIYDHASPFCKNVSVIPCGVNTDAFFPRVWKPDESLRLLFPGSRDRWVKNYSLFKSVALELQALSDSIELHMIERLNVPAFMSKANVLLLTSHSEGSPQVIKEAMALDMCIASVDVGDVRVMIENVPGCYCFDINAEIMTVSENIRLAFIEAKKTPGARRARLELLQLSNKLVVSAITAGYTVNTCQ